MLNTTTCSPPLALNTFRRALRFTDARYRGYLANMSPSLFARLFEKALPESMSGHEFVQVTGVV